MTNDERDNELARVLGMTVLEARFQREPDRSEMVDALRAAIDGDLYPAAEVLARIDQHSEN